MHPLAHRVAQRSVNHLVALDQRTAFELRRDDERLEVIAASGQVLYLDIGARKRLFDRKFELYHFHEKRILARSKRRDP